ncbi:EEF1A lysine methyltransferase 1 isoform X2 [Centruroides vittatus]|uniref:EEF1A lysine methyltransferase 1 isoform X2 n=1 Tax=Centruroides vittatus TaxID=120091 RepID=UPI0035104C02
MEDDDDIPQLSAETLRALYEFYEERTSKMTEEMKWEKKEIEEDWQLSQFWYDETTAEILAKEAIALAGDNGKIACISCPTVYKKLRSLNDGKLQLQLRLLEYDKRFGTYGDDFLFYDYKSPLDLDRLLETAFDVVLADPPYLSEECLSNMAETIKFLAKDKIILCTGAVMEELAHKLLGVKKCSLKINHKKNLGNKFNCYVNYEPSFA